uniref:Uncharacterized protein n=1 Tax=Amphimedon queenslandica TaxID=400682 RepID=A0A1X7UNS4_AMPQE
MEFDWDPDVYEQQDEQGLADISKSVCGASAVWSERFEKFWVASGLDKVSEEKQTNTLHYCMKEDAEVVMDSTNHSVGHKKVIATVLQKFEFNRCSQMEEETMEQFIIELYRLADNCNYQGFRDKMIRDRLMVGIRDQRVSEHMQFHVTLDLEKAKKMVRQQEAVTDQS